MSKERFVNNTLSELQQANSSPIFGYEGSPVLTLEEAVENIIPLISRLMDYVTTAKKKYNRHSPLLTRDESAAVYLYSMPTSFFTRLNETLRAENRQALKPWFAYLKLFMTALEKLPSTKQIVWRGVSDDVGSVFANGDTDIWWSVTSCSMDLKIVQPFIGERGTLFAIEAMHGKDISEFSANQEEQEVILMPGTRISARNEPLSFIDRLFIVHLEEVTIQSQSQSETNHLFQWIKQEYQQNGRIELLMNPAKFYPIQQSYINLAIVETKTQQEKEKQLRDASHIDAIIGSFEEIYGTKTIIDIKNIFETCKDQKNQVLVFGRAGIGKSTFCRYIAYQWAMGSYWTQYQLLALIPLRRLTINRYPPLPLGQSYSLIDLVKKEAFPYDLSEKEDKILKQYFDPKKTLWILDGYDEIVGNVPAHLECLFEQLLKTSHHILTSRPYQNTLPYHVQMEITGFTDENIQQYVQQFFDQMKDELDNASIKSQKLFRFLWTNQSVWGVAHIPVNLELICSLWSNEDFMETKELKITALYSMMTEWLCRRYLSIPNKNIQNLTKDDVNQRCEKELAFLDNLAFNAMKNNTIILRPNLLKKALNEAKVSSHDHPHILNIGILKSFNKQGVYTGIDTEKEHYFVHLSFQEYFAARYLINALNGSFDDKTNAIEFIKTQKYNQRYALVFTFVSGLCSETDANTCLNIFWETILTSPLDLVGIRHIQLVICCIEETSTQSIIPGYSELLQWIARCVEYNLSINNKIILLHLFQSLERAQSVLSNERILNVFINLIQSDDSNIKEAVLLFISKVNISIPSVALITSVVNALDNLHENIRSRACQALGNIGEKEVTNEVITKLLSALGDESEWVRYSACEALEKIGEKAATNEVITKLLSALGDESYSVRSSACHALWKIGENAATNEVITKLVSALGDESARVIRSACEALGNIGEKAATNEVITELVSALGDENYVVRTSACRALWKIGEEAATNEVITELVSALEDACVWVRSGACDALSKIGEKAVTNEVITKLVSALGDEYKDVRSSACKALGSIGERAATNEVIIMLVSALGDESEWVRYSACKALGSIGERAATNEVIIMLVSALEDESVRVRTSACEALSKIGEKAATNEVITKLVSALENESVEVEISACDALGKIVENAATNEVITKLLNALGDESVSIRFGASRALSKIGEKAATNEVITKLVTALGDESEDVSFRACEALSKIGEKAWTTEVITKLVSTLGDESKYVRSHACEALSKIGEKAWTDEVITKLVSALGDDSVRARSGACDALGKIGEKAWANEVITKLVGALGDESADVRSHAWEAIGSIGEKAATNKVITMLVSALGDASELVRKSACGALSKIGEKAATNEVITKLVSALGDESYHVKSSACEALTKMGEKVATNTVITKIMTKYFIDGYLNDEVADALDDILSLSTSIIEIDPTLILQICLCKREFLEYRFWYRKLKCLKNIVMDELIRKFFDTQNPDWLPLVAYITLRKGAGLVITENTVMVYDKGEPVVLHISNLKLRQELIEVLTNQTKQLHLSF